MQTENMIRIRNGETELLYPAGTTWFEVAGELFEKGSLKRPALLVKVDGRLRELRNPIEDGEVSWICADSADGMRTLHRSMSLMMLRAIWEIGKGEEGYRTTIHYVVSDGLYCTLSDPALLTDEFLGEVEKRMRSLQSRALPITKYSVKTSEACRQFRDSFMPDKERLMHYRMSSHINLYELDGYTDYYYGYMAADTSALEHFELVRYKEGFVLRMPDMAAPDELPPFRPDEMLFETQNRSLKWGEQMGICCVPDLNEHIVNGQRNKMILIQEAYHERQVAEIARKIAEDPKRRIVMIAGPSSSGKTTFSHRLSTQLAVYGLTPHPIPTDDYFKNRADTPLDENGEPNFECLEAMDVELFNEDMTALLRGERVELPTYNFKTGMREYKGKFKQLSDKDVLVIEGIHCLNDALSYRLPRESKFKIYISALTQLNIDEHNRVATTDGRLLRRMIRDARTRGTEASATLHMWPSVRRGEEQYIFPYQETADVMFNSALIYELSVLKVYAEPLLYGIDPNSPEYSEAKRLLKFLDYLVPMPSDEIPNNSLLREFIGGSCFDV